MAIPAFAEKIKESAQKLFSEVDNSKNYWNDSRADDFHSYLQDSSYKHSIDEFADEMTDMLDVLNKNEEKIRNLESECFGSSGSAEDGSMDAKERGHTNYENEAPIQKGELFQKGQDKIQNMPQGINPALRDYLLKQKQR